MITLHPIVLVHGAWSNGRVFDVVVSLLEAKGHEVIAVNLPGHGSDTTSHDELHLQSYVDAVRKAVGTRTRVLLVGNSMAGLVISAVKEQMSDQIERLIYVGAFIPQNGDSTFALSGTDEESHFGKFIAIDQTNNSGTFTAEGYRDVFAAYASPADLDKIVANAKSESLGPLQESVTLTQANFGRAKITYIFTVEDHALGYKLQQKMVERANVERFYALPSDHWPFLSFPGVVSEILSQEGTTR